MAIHCYRLTTVSDVLLIRQKKGTGYQESKMAGGCWA